MSETPEDSGKTGAFFLGMLIGMLIAGGAAGTFFVTQTRHQEMLAREAMMAAEMAREEAEIAHREAVRARVQAEAAARKAKE